MYRFWPRCSTAQLEVLEARQPLPRAKHAANGRECQEQACCRVLSWLLVMAKKLSTLRVPHDPLSIRGGVRRTTSLHPHRSACPSAALVGWRLACCPRWQLDICIAREPISIMITSPLGLAIPTHTASPPAPPLPYLLLHANGNVRVKCSSTNHPTAWTGQAAREARPPCWE